MKLKLPSLKEMSEATFDTIKRFPFAIIYAFILTIYSIVLVHSDFSDERFFYALHVLSLGIIFSVGVSIYSEIKKIASSKNILINLIVLVVLIGYFLTFKVDYNNKILYRILIITFVSVFMLLSLPYFNKNNQLNYWRYNFRIFNRFVLSSFFSMIIYAGLAIALGVINLLFNVNIEGRVFADLAIIIAGLFAVTNFLSGFPKEFYYNNEFDYPKGLRIFVQFILLPLTTLYLAILFVYMFKILFTWEMPQGSISYLVLSFSAVGLLSLMIIFPIKNNPDNKWVSNYGKYFFFAIIPLIFLLFISILIRISEYGITENRYYIVVFAIWLAAIAVYSIITKFKNVKIISISFSLLFLIVSFGPWSSFNVSKISQLKQLDKLIQQYDILPNGQIKNEYTEVPDSIYNQIKDIAGYVYENHGLKSLENNLNINLDTIDTLGYRYSFEYDFMDYLKISYLYSYDYQNDKNLDYYYFSIYGGLDEYDIAGFDKLYNVYYYYYDSTDVFIDNIVINYDNNNLLLSIDTDTVKINLEDYIKTTLNKYNDTYVTDTSGAVLVDSVGNTNFKIIIKSLSGTFDTPEFKDITFDFDLLVDYPEE